MLSVGGREVSGWGPATLREESEGAGAPPRGASSKSQTGPRSPGVQHGEGESPVLAAGLLGLTGASTWGAEVPLAGRLLPRQSREGRKGGFKPHGWLTGFPHPPRSHPSLSRVILRQCWPLVSAPRWSQEGCRQ